MTNDEFFAICPGATWPDELSESAWKAALHDIQIITDAENRGLRAALLQAGQHINELRGDERSDPLIDYIQEALRIGEQATSGAISPPSPPAPGTLRSQ